MIRNILILLAAVTLCACQAGPRHRSNVNDPEAWTKTNSLTEVATFAATLPTKKTLVVFDIDDTLLSTPYIAGSKNEREFFGSDSWYVWQSNLDSKDRDKIPKQCLYDFLAINYETGTQEATESDAGEIIKRIAADTIFVTSRSPDYRGGTERELEEAHIGMPAPLSAGLGAIVRREDDKGAVDMVYLHGVYMTKGGDKGKALIALLDELKVRRKKYSHVVMVDDGLKNIKAMSNALNTRRIRFHGFLYTGIKTDPEANNPTPPPAGPNPKAEQAWKAWEIWFSALESAYPRRAARLRDLGCPAKGPERTES